MTLKKISENPLDDKPQRRAFLQPPFFCPMLKANAYGHGVAPVAKALFSVGVKQVGVLSANEAWPIKEMAEEMDILIFGPILNKEDLSWIAEENLVVVCNNWQDLKSIAQLKKPLRIHLKFDTGFSRLGFDLDSAEEIYDFLKQQTQIQLEGLATQLVSGEELGDKKSFSSYQLKLFAGLKKFFPQTAFHALNSSALTSVFAHGEKRLFGSRPGIALYGIKPEIFFNSPKAKEKWKSLPLAPVSCLKSPVVAERKISKGTPVSYGGSWKAPRRCHIATLSLGYGDGFSRSFGALREVLFRGKKRPVVGALCMDFFMIDVTGCETEGPIRLGEEALIFGRQKGEFLSPETQAKAISSIPYELFSQLGPRVERVYKNDSTVIPAKAGIQKAKKVYKNDSEKSDSRILIKTAIPKKNATPARTCPREKGDGNPENKKPCIKKL